jgi:predicted DCC family thiol-disulfide oxidoreductase YuxK
VLYDGVCGLCNRVVAWLLAHDREERLLFTPLQGETAGRLRALHDGLPEGLDSIALVDSGTVYLRSMALLRAARFLDRPWRWAFRLRWLPARPLDLLYGAIARVRYRIWGRFESCPLPSSAQRHRFLP